MKTLLKRYWVAFQAACACVVFVLLVLLINKNAHADGDGLHESQYGMPGFGMKPIAPSHQAPQNNNTYKLEGGQGGYTGSEQGGVLIINEHLGESLSDLKPSWCGFDCVCGPQETVTVVEPSDKDGKAETGKKMVKLLPVPAECVCASVHLCQHAPTPTITIQSSAYNAR